jgi:hypothetical protein
MSNKVSTVSNGERVYRSATRCLDFPQGAAQ